MASNVQVTATSTIDVGRLSSTNVVRDSSGIPYVLAWGNSGNYGLFMYKGNSATPTSFTEQDNAGKPTDGSLFSVGACAIDSSDVIHVLWLSHDGKNSELRYVTFATSTDTWGTDVSADTTAFGPGVGTPRIAVAVDSSDVPHCVYSCLTTNMGTDYQSVYYINRVGGSWNSPVQIDGSNNSRDCEDVHLCLTDENVPEIVYTRVNTSLRSVFAGQGNANNATSFTLSSQLGSSYNNAVDARICCDSSGNTFVAACGSNTAGLGVFTLADGSAFSSSWTTRSPSSPGTRSNGTGMLALVASGTDVYALVSINGTGIRWSTGDHSTSFGSWTTHSAGEGELVGQWAFAVDRDASGNDVGEHQTTNSRSEILFLVRESASLRWRSFDLSTDPNLQPSLYTNTQTFYSPTVTPGAVTLTPSLYTNNQTFYSPTVLGQYELTPSLYTNNQSFFGPTVTVGPATLTPSLYTNNQSFFSPTVTPGAVTLTPSLYTNNQTFYSPTVAASYDLTAPLYDDTPDTFYGPTVTPGTVTLTPSLHTNDQTFYGPEVSLAGSTQTLTPSLFTNTNSFFAPTVLATYELTPSLFTNNQTFYGPTVSATYELTPALFTNNQTFYGPTVAATYSLTAPLLDDTPDTFYGPTVTGSTVTLQPSLYTNNQTFYGPTMALSYELTPSLYTNNQTFYGPTVTLAGGTQTLLPSLFTNTNQFFAPTVLGQYELTPALLTNNQSFFGPTVDASYELTPALFTNGHTFYSPTVVPEGVGLSPSLLTNSQTFYGPTVENLNSLFPNLLSDGETFYGPTVSPGTATISPSLFTNEQVFFGGQIPQGDISPVAPALFVNPNTFRGGHKVTQGLVKGRSPRFLRGEVGPNFTTKRLRMPER